MLTTAGNTSYVSLICQWFQSSVPMKQPSKHNGFKPHHVVLIDFPSSAGWALLGGSAALAYGP